MGWSRASVKRADHWEVGLWLVFDSNGGVRMTRTEPGTSAKERALFITAKVPFSLFRIPQLRATLTLGERPVPDTDLDLSAAESALSEALGAQVELTIKGEDDARTT